MLLLPFPVLPDLPALLVLQGPTLLCPDLLGLQAILVPQGLPALTQRCPDLLGLQGLRVLLAQPALILRFRDLQGQRDQPVLRGQQAPLGLRAQHLQLPVLPDPLGLLDLLGMGLQVLPDLLDLQAFKE